MIILFWLCWRCDWRGKNGKDGIQLLGNVTPEFIKVGKIKRTIFSGTSKAAAREAAVLLEQCVKGRKSFEHMIRTWKENLPYNAGNMLEQIESRGYKVKLHNEQLYEKIAGILKQMGYDLKDDGSDCYFDRIVRDTEEFAWLIPEILNRFDVSVVPEEMHYFDFMSVYALANYLEKYT